MDTPDTTYPDLEQGPLSDTSFKDDDESGTGIVNDASDSDETLTVESLLSLFRGGPRYKIGSTVQREES